MIKLIKKIAHITAIIFIIIIVLSAISVSIARVVFVDIDNYHDVIVGKISRSIGKPVTVGKITADWDFKGPELVLHDVVIKDHDSLLHVSLVTIDFSLASSILHLTPEIETVVVNKVFFDLQNTGRTSNKNVKILQKSILATEAATIVDHKTLNDFISAQGNTATIITDLLHWLKGRRWLYASDVQVAIRSANGVIGYRIPALLFKQYGQGYVVSGKLGEINSFSLGFYLMIGPNIDNLDKLNLHGYLTAGIDDLNKWMPNNNFVKINHGSGVFNSWLTVKSGQIIDLRVDFEIKNLILSSDKTGDISTLMHQSGSLLWQNKKQGWSLSGRNLDLYMGDKHYPLSNIIIKRKTSSRTSQLETQLYANKLDLSIVPLLADESTIIPQQYVDLWYKLSPHGDLKNFNLNWTGTLLPTASTSKVHSNFDNIGFAPYNNIPGFDNLSGQISWHGSDLNLKFDSRNIVVSNDSYFESPFRLDSLFAIVDVARHENNFWQIKASQIDVHNSGVNILGDLGLSTPESLLNPLVSGVFSIKTINAGSMVKYIPIKALSPDLSKWLGSTFGPGNIDGSIVFRGHIFNNGFDSANSTLTMKFPFSNLYFKFNQDWPAITNASGEVRVDGTKLGVNVTSGLTQGNKIITAKATVPSLTTNPYSTLTIKGKIDSNVNSALDYLRNSKLNEFYNKLDGKFSASGNVSLDLDLVIPLGIDTPQNKINGQLNFSNSKVNIYDAKLTATNINGVVNFTQNSLSSNNLKGYLLGKPFDLYLKKSVPKTETTSVNTYSRVQSARDKVGLDHSGAVNGQRLNISFISPLTITEWLSYYHASYLTPYFSPSQVYHFTASIPLDLQNQTSIYLKPTIIQPTSGYIKDIKFLIDNNDQGLTFDFDSNASSGQLVLGEAWHTKGFILDFKRLYLKKANFIDDVLNKPKQITRDNSKLIVASPSCGKSQDSKVAGEICSRKFSIDPQDILPVVIKVNDLRYRNKLVGKAYLELRPIDGGVELKQLKIDNDNLSISSTGSWTNKSGNMSTKLMGKLTATNLGASLNNWGISDSVKNTSGTITYDLRWPGGPQDYSSDMLLGDVSFRLKNGSIINLDQSVSHQMLVGKILNLLSIQSLLSIQNFGKSGYTFSKYTGDINFSKGVLTCDNALLDGVVAKITAAGDINLIDESYDINLAITPYVTSSLPLVLGAVTLNPLVGIAAWVANQVVAPEIGKIIVYKYSLTGPWDKPILLPLTNS